ncbi:MAG TPA: bifunctional hydroxymethylpyrimidine kinase/phosphomethylpyrimidine kinase [Xanthomonadales bacterium]|nr:bifunctional hydroxymethylpyrimidine kinase/phosphomethylpyrimidine kinase [Xanthomonadales bacterium]
MHKANRKIDVVALTIAGSDSCGGAGIQADLRTFQNFAVHGASVITAITAQNTLAVHATQAITAENISAQLHAVLDDLPVAAIKTGMLPDAAAIEAISEVIRSRCAGIPLIVDPVLVATSGAALTVEDTINALREELIPLATVVTPNLEEAVLLDIGPAQQHAPIDAARALLQLGCRAVLLKGGHGDSDQVTDRLLIPTRELEFSHDNVPGDFHGTGCTLSAAIAALMAKGESLENSTRQGIDHVHRAIANARLPLSGRLHLLN